jgi:putative hydrolase
VADEPQFGEPDDPDDPDDDSTPFAFGPFPGGLGGFDPSTFDFSQVDLNQVMRMLQSTGPVNWEIARQTAEWVALEGKPDPVVDDRDREQLDELARAAQTLVVGETGLAATFAASVTAVGPKGWSELHLRALRPVLEALATTLGEAMQADVDALGDDEAPVSAAFPGFPEGIPLSGGMLAMLAPALLGVQAGSMIGYLAQHALGRYDLPLPTGPLPTSTSDGGDPPTLCFVVPNIDAFERDWSLPREDLRFYVALHEVVHAAVRSVPWVRGMLVQLSVDYVSSYEINPEAFEDAFGDLDPSDPESLQRMAQSPERVLGAMQSPRQQVPREGLQRLTAVIDGYADYVLEAVGRRLITSFDQIHEAMKRHRVERGEAERFIEGLLGLKLERTHYERGEAFCRGVVERAGADGLNRLWEGAHMLPTPAELDAPGLWLARIELGDDRA